MANVDASARWFQDERMPSAINDLRGYRLFFFSLDRSETVHSHVAKGRGYAKYWPQPLTLARSRNFRDHELDEIARLVETNRHEIERKWHERFSPED